MKSSCRFLRWGPFTNDVSRVGEEGGLPISEERKGGCVDLVLTRGEGVRNPENLADVICERPLACPRRHAINGLNVALARAPRASARASLLFAHPRETNPGTIAGRRRRYISHTKRLRLLG